jgi:hypothetical protein
MDNIRPRVNMIIKYLLIAGSVLMGISFFLPWVTIGDVFSGYSMADMYQRMNEDQLYLRFASVPKIAIGILFFTLFNAPRNFVYYVVPVLSLIPLVVLDADMFKHETIHFGFYLLHLSVILLWIGAFSYKYQSVPLVKSAAKK